MNTQYCALGLPNGPDQVESSDQQAERYHLSIPGSPVLCREDVETAFPEPAVDGCERDASDGRLDPLYLLGSASRGPASVKPRCEKIIGQSTSTKQGGILRIVV